MLPTTPDKRATALVITVGLLAVLAVIGFGFAVLSRLHHDISKYYRASAQNELVARAAIFYAVREIRFGYSNCPHGISHSFQAGAIAEPTDSPQDPWFLDPSLAVKGYADEDYCRYCNLKCNSYSLVHDDLGPRVGVSLIEVLDSAGKLNINDRYDDAELTYILSKLLDEVGITDASTLAQTIITRRNALPDRRFASLRQLLEKDPDGNYLIEGMDERKFEVLKHYLTIYSWPHQIPSTKNFTPYVVRPSEAGSLKTLERDDSTGTGYPPDHVRSPININTAPEELLVALLSAIEPPAGVTISTTDARDIAKWIVRKRDPENHNLWLGRDDEAEWSTWEAWFKSGDNYTTDYRRALERQFPGWRAHPIGPFDSWHEVTDFLYSLASNPPRPAGASDPYPETLTLAQAEAVLAAISPNPLASIVGHNTWTLAYARLNDEKSTDNDLQAQQCLRDRNASDTIVPTHYGKNDLAADGDVHPLCFSSMGRHEIYSRTYVFVKADQGVVVSLDDNDKPTFLTCRRPGDIEPHWSETPPQWRGYSVLIYDGKGKGVLRGIVTNTSSSLAVAQIPFSLSTSGDDQTRFYIVGPPAFVDRVDTAGEISVSESEPHILTDTSDDFAWEDDEWNGHRIVLYQSETVTRTLPDGSTIQDENVDRGTIQERIIVDTRRVTGGHQIIVSPPFDYGLADLSAPGMHLSYMILGCDGLVEHEAAIKAYDVIHHTTQRDFEQYKAQATMVETGPYPFGTTADPTAATLDDACKVDGWIALAKKKADPPDANALVQNFDNVTEATPLRPEQGESTAPGTSVPERSLMIRDPFEGGRLTSEGLVLRSATSDHLDFTTAAPPVTGNHTEGGFVSFWFRPDEAFLSAAGQRTIVQVFGSSTSGGQEEDIRLIADGNVLKLVVRANKQQTHTGNVKFRIGVQRQHTDPNHSDISAWQPGEWHHIAFAWYECDDSTATDDDGSDATSRFDDDDPGPDQELDDEVKGRLRLWVDGQSSALAGDNEVYAFNLTPPGSGPNLRFGDQLSGTIDGIIVRAHSNPNLNLTVPANPQRYADSSNEGTFQSAPISLNVDTGGEHVTLGTVSWTGWLPWCTDAERWDQSNAKFPIRLEVALGASWADPIPYQGSNYQPPLGGGAPLRHGHALDPNNNSLVESDAATSIKYKIYLRRDFGEAAGGTAPASKILGRQTPVLDDITITYLGPVVFFFWK